MDRSPPVYISFFIDEECIFSFFSNVYPPYFIGGIIWLETIAPPVTARRFPNAQGKPLTGYRIVGIEHSVREDFSENDIDYHCSMDVQIERIKKQAPPEPE